MRWLVNNTVIKLLVVVLCIKEIWLLLGVPSISNAIITFTTLGVIPGTNTSLSPLGMLLVSIAIAIVVSSFLFRKDLEELLRRHDAATATTQEQPAGVELVPTKPVKPMTVRSIWLQKQLHRLSPAGNWLRATMEFWFWSLVVATLQVTRIVVAVSLMAWRTSEPYIRKFDHWLDMQLHKYEPTAKVLTLSAEITDTVHTWVLKAKAVYDELSTTRQIHKSDQ